MKLFFDPVRNAVVTEHGEMVEGVRNLSITYDAGSLRDYGPLCEMSIYMNIKECPEVSPEKVQGAISGLRQIESHLDGR